ncbi:MAG: MarR family transcriptional regulator [Candidatus Sericytochromatia bacterium]
MQQEILAYLETHPDANSYGLCQHFGISRAMAERVLELLEDAGEIVLQKPGDCPPGGGCSTATTTLNALADAARSRKA